MTESKQKNFQGLKPKNVIVVETKIIFKSCLLFTRSAAMAVT